MSKKIDKSVGDKIKLNAKIQEAIKDKYYKDKYPIAYSGPVKEEKYGDWKSVAELIDFKIVFTSPSTLLSPANVDVMFLYKLPAGKKESEQKKLVIFGKEEAVKDKAISIINRKKNKRNIGEFLERFVKAWEKARLDGYSSFNKKDKFNPFNLTQPTSLLSRAIEKTGIDKKTFAEKIGKKSASLYHHTKGIREISRETAIEYAEKLNCDPVDLLFNKLTLPVWAKTNTLKTVELEDYHKPCKLYSYYTDKAERVIVPRDIYRSDLKAIQVDAKGSMYDGQVGFYYFSKTKDVSHSNKLVVVGVKEKGFMDEEEFNYYFGLYEEIRGKSNLINPDPYIENMEDKYVLKNFNPEFIAPIVAMVNPNQIVDNTSKQTNLPAEEFRKEENILRALEKLKVDLRNEQIREEQRRKLELELRAHQEKLEKQIALMEKRMNEEKSQGGFFWKEQRILDKLRDPLVKFTKTGTDD